MNLLIGERGQKQIDSYAEALLLEAPKCVENDTYNLNQKRTHPTAWLRQQQQKHPQRSSLSSISSMEKASYSSTSSSFLETIFHHLLRILAGQDKRILKFRCSPSKPIRLLVSQGQFRVKKSRGEGQADPPRPGRQGRGVKGSRQIAV